MCLLQCRDNIAIERRARCGVQQILNRTCATTRSTPTIRVQYRLESSSRGGNRPGLQRCMLWRTADGIASAHFHGHALVLVLAPQDATSYAVSTPYAYLPGCACTQPARSLSLVHGRDTELVEMAVEFCTW